MPGRANAEESLRRWRQVASLREKGYSTREVAKLMGLAQGTVSYYVAKGPPPRWAAPKLPEVELPKLPLSTMHMLPPVSRTARRTTKPRSRSVSRSGGGTVVQFPRRLGGGRR